MFDQLGLLVVDHGSSDHHDHDNHVGMWEAVKSIQISHPQSSSARPPSSLAGQNSKRETSRANIR